MLVHSYTLRTGSRFSPGTGEQSLGSFAAQSWPPPTTVACSGGGGRGCSRGVLQCGEGGCVESRVPPGHHQRHRELLIPDSASPRPPNLLCTPSSFLLPASLSCFPFLFPSFSPCFSFPTFLSLFLLFFLCTISLYVSTSLSWTFCTQVLAAPLAPSLRCLIRK